MYNTNVYELIILLTLCGIYRRSRPCTEYSGSALTSCDSARSEQVQGDHNGSVLCRCSEFSCQILRWVLHCKYYFNHIVSLRYKCKKFEGVHQSALFLLHAVFPNRHP